MYKTIRNKYFAHLCSIIDGSERYLNMLEILHDLEFYSLIPNDENRVKDGRMLREYFLDEEGAAGASSLPDVPCTVLEMLIALSYRLEFETVNSRWEKSTSEWFWILINNLGLSDCDDNSFFKPDTRNYIIRTVVNMVERGYRKDGFGGLFPLKNPKKDQRRVEIWYQMSAYLLENYPI
jgi:hypothetical protein